MTETLNPIFNYSSARQFLLDQVSHRQKSQETSLRSLAKDMGFSSHTLLLALLQGKRQLLVRHSQPIAKGLGLSSQERLYLQALIQFENADEIEEKKICELWLSELHPQNAPYRSQELDEYSFFANWIHTAVLAATYLKTPLYSAKDIAHLYRHHISLTEAHAALERLLHLNLIAKDDTGRLISVYKQISSREDITNKAVQEYHKQMSLKAHEAIEKAPVEEREFQSFSLPLEKDKINLAKDMIRQFRQRLISAVGSESGDSIYQINLQFFELSQSMKENKESSHV